MFAISIERVSGSGSLPRRFSDAVELSGVVFPRRVTGGVYIGSGGLLVGVQASGGECASVLVMVWILSMADSLVHKCVASRCLCSVI